jgi:hypothetical protein
MPRLRPRSFLIALFSLVLLAGAGAPAIAQDATPTGGEVTILGPDESYAGVTRGDWNARWWQWGASFPPEIHPSFTPPGTASCAYGQSGPMFFLPSHYASESITCVVPEGTAIFVSLGGAFCSTVEPPPFFGRNEEELRACAANVTEGVTDNQASINGEEVPDLETYRTTSPLFTLALTEDNIYELPEGIALAVTDNYSFIIAPPPPGEYVIEYSWMLEGDPVPWMGTYEITVMAPQVIEPEATPNASPEAATPVA